MRFYRVSFIYFLAFYAVKCKASCQASKDTITYVSSCPRTLMEWKWRAEAKKCWLVKQQCIPSDKFVYHCVVNGYTNATMEVCAKAATVIGHSCVEFNMLGEIIQESPDYKCEKSCPFSYNSTDAYKYQMCFNIANVEEEKECSHCICPSKEYSVLNASMPRLIIRSNPISREEIWQIVAIVLLIAIIVVIIVFAIWKITKRKFNRGRRTMNNLSNSNEEEKSLVKKKRYIASIEISKSYFCWAVQNNEDNKKCAIVQKNENNNYPTWKQPTSILITKDKDLEKMYFGYDAIDKFIELKKNASSDWAFIHKMKKISSQGNETILPRSDRSDIYAKILDFIIKKIKIKAKYEPKGGGSKADGIEYVITIPTHWKYKAKKSLKAFEKAINDSIEIKSAKTKIIVTKAEVVSPFLHEVKADVLCQNFNVDHLSFEEDTKYAILDIGTTACELTILTSKKDAKDQEDEPIRKKWLKTVEEGFLDLLSSMFGFDLIDKFKKDEGSLQELLLSFEKIKTGKEIFKENAKSEPLPIPTALVELIKREGKLPQEEIDSYLRRENVKCKETSPISWKEENDNCFLCIGPKEIQKLFKPMLDSIRDTIELQFSGDKNRYIKCVCIIGGNANTKLVHKEARNCFPERTVIIPREADLVVVQGAVYYGYKYIKNAK